MTDTTSLHQNSFLELFSIRLKQARKEAGLTQDGLAESSDVSKGSISSYENGSKLPSAYYAIKIASALNVPLGWLCGENGCNKEGNLDSAVFLKYIDKLLEKKELSIHKDDDKYSITISGKCGLFEYIEMLNKYKLTNDLPLDEKERNILFQYYLKGFKEKTIEEIIE